MTLHVSNGAICSRNRHKNFLKYTLTKEAVSVCRYVCTSSSFVSQASRISEDRRVTFEASDASKMGLVWPAEI